jgi:hypothetical protein
MVLPIVDFRVPIVNSAGEVVMLDDFYEVGHRQLGSLMTLGLRALERAESFKTQRKWPNSSPVTC